MQVKIALQILLVEDNIVTAFAGKLLLERHGYAVHHVASGEEAVVTALDDGLHFDLILMDIDPGHGMEGTEAAKQILEERDIPLIFLSSHTERAIVEKTEGITSYGYIVKNSGETVLLASIKMALKLFESRALARAKQLEIEANQRKWRAFLENSPDIIAVIDGNGLILELNHYADGFVPEKVLGTPAINFIAPNFRQDWSDHFAACVINLKLQIFETRAYGDNRSLRVYENYLIPVTGDPSGLKVILVARDITEKKDTEL